MKILMQCEFGWTQENQMASETMHSAQAQSERVAEWTSVGWLVTIAVTLQEMRPSV